MKHQTAVKLIPNEVAKIDLVYRPVTVLKNFCYVKLHVMYNPYETTIVSISFIYGF